MPAKTSTTTRKHGTVVKIRIYADEKKRLDRLIDDMDELCTMIPNAEDKQKLNNAMLAVCDIARKYANYSSNGKEDNASLVEEEEPNDRDR